MDTTHTRLDPTFPVCWEDPETLRVGFERPVARLNSPTPGMQRFVSALREGVDPSRLSEEARRTGATLAEARSTLDEMRPALARLPVGSPGQSGLPPRRRAPEPRDDSPAVRTVICDDDLPVRHLGDALAATSLCRPARLGAAPNSPERPELVIFVERYWSPLGRAQRWLMDDVPHLLLRFTDGEVHVGPLVGAGGSPCHTCVSLARVENDPATGVLAAQLAGTRTSSENRGTVMLSAAFAAEHIEAWITGEDRALTTRVVLPVAAGLSHMLPRVETVLPHPDCACAQLGSVSAPPRSCPPRR
ncbi:TOMM precursor leader peptide-binding protein [Leucobacter sp. USHLN153]|uniref:TOMM precursor leader peptide-binding protein n=1 Tax=Leucobacter sp. USHLN153 TaxID=3081268 RepID=UPI00301AE279